MSIESDAKFLMSNEAFVQAIESVQKYHMNKAMACGPKDDHGRRIHLEHAKNVNRISGHLNALLTAAKSGEEVNPDDFYKERANKVFALFNK